MKLIIDIDEEWYSNIIASKDYIDKDTEAYLILNGTPYEERPHGEWICHICHSDSYITFYTCNRCNGFGYKDDKFCNNCGADMRKGGAE